MYNTRRTGNSSPRGPPNQHNTRRLQHQQLPQTMPHVATFVTPKATNQAQVQFQNQPQPMQSLSGHNLQSQPQGLQPFVQTSTPIPGTLIKEANDSLKHELKATNLDQLQFQNQPQHTEIMSQSQGQQPLVETSTSILGTQNQETNASAVPELITNIKNEDNQSTEDTNMEKFNRYPKRKINKKEQKKRLNARMRRLVSPKSPLMVFSELYKDIPINIEDTPNENGMHYTASFEVDGQLYVGKHQAKTQAKQKACENFLRILLAKKMSEQSVKKEDCADSEIEDGENSTSAKPKGPPQEDFPWPHFASLAMHNLINHWELQPIPKVLPEEAIIKQTPKLIGGMKKFPQNPENYNPVQLLHQMAPGIHFIEKTLNHSNPSLFEASCEINKISFKGQGSTKKAAKKECSIYAIKHFWNFDFHSISVK